MWLKLLKPWGSGELRTGQKNQVQLVSESGIVIIYLQVVSTIPQLHFLYLHCRNALPSEGSVAEDVSSNLCPKIDTSG